MVLPAATSTSMWQRRTNRIILKLIIVIGLTMMISNISQCIYIGLFFIFIALLWLVFMTVREKKNEPPRPEVTPQMAPLEFLVTSHHLPQVVGGAGHAVTYSDTPPSYDQIQKSDGLPPDYLTVFCEKPPRYEDLAAFSYEHGACALPPAFKGIVEIPAVHSLSSNGKMATAVRIDTSKLPPGTVCSLPWSDLDSSKSPQCPEETVKCLDGLPDTTIRIYTNPSCSDAGELTAVKEEPCVQKCCRVNPDVDKNVSAGKESTSTTIEKDCITPSTERREGMGDASYSKSDADSV